MTTALALRADCRQRIVRADECFRAWFEADWVDALFVHYAIAPEVLQPHVPFELELFDDLAWVSLVAFTQRGLRPARGGRAAAWAMRPAATHGFLNLRTYVRGGPEGDRGICFLAEWIPNRLALAVGPVLYGLPFRLGRLRYGERERCVKAGGCAWQVEVATERRAGVEAGCGTLDEFLLERYTAFCARRGRGYRFDIRHRPWLWQRAEVRVAEDSLIREAAPWFAEATMRGAHWSEGSANVRMGGPKAARMVCRTR
jgi:uncharacterized protein YqjF (DUF2071 family)